MAEFRIVLAASAAGKAEVAGLVQDLQAGKPVPGGVRIEGGTVVANTSHWDVDPAWPLEQWKYEVENNDTRMGYHEWVEHERGIAGDEATDGQGEPR